MQIEIEHRISLTLPPGTVSAVLHLLLTPGAGATQGIESWSVEAAGIGNAARFADAYGNMVHLVNLSRPEGEIVLTARGVVSTRDKHGVLGKPGGEPVPALFKRVTGLTRLPDDMFYGAFKDSKQSRLDVLHGLMAQVGEALGEPGVVVGQAQMQANGSPEQRQEQVSALPPAADHAHLFIAAARALDIPARFVNGYLLGGDDHPGGLHAWAEAYDEGLGWIGFDPALQLCATERHVRLATGLDAEAAQPLRTVPMGEIVQSVSVRAAGSA